MKGGVVTQEVFMLYDENTNDKEIKILRLRSIKLLDAIAQKAPRRIALVVDAASVQLELGSITNAAIILVKSKIRQLVELANQIIERAESLYKEVKQYEH